MLSGVRGYVWNNNPLGSEPNIDLTLCVSLRQLFLRDDALVDSCADFC